MSNMRRVGALMLALGTMLSGLVVAAETKPVVLATPAANVSDVQVPIYKSRVLTTRTAVKRISVGNPEIADILITSPTQLYLLGRSLGSTNVLLWDGSNRLIDSLDLEVVHDLSGLKSKLHQVMPNEPIEVFSAQGALVLRGQVSSAAAMDNAVKLARSYAEQAAGDAKRQGAGAAAQPQEPLQLINLLSVGGSQQVMLEVKVAEMQRNLFKNLNVRFNALDFGSSGRWSGGGFNNGQGLGFDEDGFVNPTTLFGDGKGIFGQFLSDNFLFNVVLEAAKDNGSAKVLAEPTLTTLTGQQAEFISGGEFPVPITEDDGITIEFKEFGVGVKFLPVVLDSGRINLNLNVSVSELSNANSLVLDTGLESILGNGVNQVIPSLTKRSAQSTVELGNGQTIAIAGLISENTRDFVSRFPGLGDVPVLGQLFRSQQFIHGETELVILVTPYLAQPVDARTVRLPTENFVEPSDAEFYLLGKTKGSAPGRAVPASLGISEGRFGHDLK
ncbi:type II and III secretion system protein family protein [Stutzerimonas frequens]|uniref:type II and III secretion system protein family protein n=1 Tax=Stutzerimonas frequens TaxID=2968969 RepID=UPI0007B983E1|nr:type II and III secretion system protein family protein [Stutzerimonas frequens]MCD1638473.1 type II and III secretion system protein family protein [Stutzerimonas stutzeri]MEC7472027.1 type II and III secretion system protein family protein [Pseudomonadota bacterium]KZX52079.1 pilus assembly protein CpaC [Stutzerimonas frequens]MBK3917478.1 type II and III secretion system protein family protein [Stutzerimonas frequens]MDL0441814.1 type II and III secretion system protein family protein [S